MNEQSAMIQIEAIEKESVLNVKSKVILNCDAIMLGTVLYKTLEEKIGNEALESVITVMATLCGDTASKEIVDFCSDENVEGNA